MLVGKIIRSKKSRRKPRPRALRNHLGMNDRGKSGGERARSPNASRGAEMLGGRASPALRESAVALAPLSGCDGMNLANVVPKLYDLLADE